MFYSTEVIKRDRAIQAFSTNRPFACKGDFLIVSGDIDPANPLTLKDTVIHPLGWCNSLFRVEYCVFSKDASVCMYFGKPFSEDDINTAKVCVTITRESIKVLSCGILQEKEVTLDESGIIEVKISGKQLSINEQTFAVNSEELNGYLELAAHGGNFYVNGFYAETEKEPCSREEHEKKFEDWCTARLAKRDLVLDELEDYIQRNPQVLPQRKGDIQVPVRLVDAGTKMRVGISCYGSANAAMVVTYDCLGASPVAEDIPLKFENKGSDYFTEVEIALQKPGNTKLELWVDGERIIRQIGVLDKGYMAVIPWIGSNRYYIDEEWHKYDIPGDYWVSGTWLESTSEQIIKYFSPYLKKYHKYGDRDVCFVNDIIKNHRTGCLYEFAPVVQEKGLRQLHRLMKLLGYESMELFASYTPDAVALGILEELGVKGLTSLCAWQNTLDGAWKINHCGVSNQPYYPADDDFRRAGKQRDIMCFTMANSSCNRNYSLMALDGCPTNVNPGQRYFDNRVVHHQLQRFYDAFDGYLADAAQNEKLMTVTVAIESFCGHMDWNAANDLAVRYMIRKAATEKIVFTSAADIAAYHMKRKMDLQPAYYFQPDYYYGLHNSQLPGNVGDRIEAVTPEYLAVVRKGNMLPLYFYDYTVPWQNAGFEEIERDVFGLVNPDEHDSAECVPAQVNRSGVRLSSCLEENCLRIYTECEREMKKMVTAVFDLPFSCDCILNANKEDVYIKKVRDSRNGNLHLFIDLGTLPAGSCEIEVRIQGSRTVPVQAEYMKDGFAAMWMKDHAYLRSVDRDEAIAIELGAPDEAFLVLENGERIHAQNGKLTCHINEEWFNEAPILYGYKKYDFEKALEGIKVTKLGRTRCSRWSWEV